VIPLRGRIVLEIERYLLEPLAVVERTPEPDDYLLYSEKRTAGGLVLAAYPKRRMSSPTIHRWWYRHAAEADLSVRASRAASTCIALVTHSRLICGALPT
jgi:hypothetical protein